VKKSLWYRVLVSFWFSLGLLGCSDDLDPPWQLDHDRIIAVRATPPGIEPGESAVIDALIGKKGEPIRVASPEAARVVSPTSMSEVLTQRDGSWVVTAPSAERLAAVRTELGLAVDAPVPLQIAVAYDGTELTAVKTVTIGRSQTNPELVNVSINDMPPGTAELVVEILAEVPLSIDANDVDYDVSWLTSCGTMHDFDLPSAYLKVEEDDPLEGELAVVLRDAAGGVAWAAWPIRAE
jgi:hypothetical protein